jgi:hypothetical protein
MQDEAMYDDDDLDESQDSRAQIPVEDLRNLRKKAKAADEAERRAAKAERELAFAKAGLDLGDAKVGYFVKGYDGDLTPESIRATAVELGFVAAPQADQQAALEARSIEQITSTAAGGQPATFDVAAELSAARNEREVMSILRRAGVPTSDDAQ